MSPVLANLCRKTLLLILATTVVVLFASWPATGFSTTWWLWVGTPCPRLLLGVGLYLAAAALGGGRWRRGWVLLASVCLLAGWSSFRVLTMGDGHWWRQATSEGTISYAEPLSSLLYAWIERWFGPGAIEWISPGMGVMATYVWIRSTDRLGAAAPGSRDTFVRLIAALVWAASGVCALFFYRYVEHTQIGIPLLVLGITNLTAWSRDVVRVDVGAGVSSRSLLRGTAQLTLAGMVHLQFMGMLVAALGAALIVGVGRGRRAVLTNAAGMAIVVAAVVGVTIGVARLSPFQVVAGSVGGGADNRLLVEFVDAHGSWFGAGTLLGADHLALVANALWYACPMVLPFAVTALVRWRRRAQRPAADLVLVSTGLAFVVFLGTYGFDLGWPRDVDLMLGMSPSLSLLVAVALLPAAAAWSPGRRRVLVVLLLVATLANWSITAPLVRPAWTNISARNSVLATLLVNGIGEGVGPFHVHAQPGVSVTLQASGPSGATFWICKGLPNPACEGNPYGGVADIEFTNGLEPAVFVHTGVFDGYGKASLSWTVQTLPDGRPAGLQMIVFCRIGAMTETTSAAFYFDAP